MTSRDIETADLQDGDVLLWRNRSLISIAGRGAYSHAGMAASWDDTWMCMEVREWVGGRCVTLQSQVDKYPGKIDVYRAREELWQQVSWPQVTGTMRSFSGCDYGWWHLLRASTLHLPGIRLFSTASARDNGNGNPPFCSEAVSAAYRLAGLDPVPNLANRLTEPSDLGRSAAFQPICTLVP
jgi:hypothetical protein